MADEKPRYRVRAGGAPVSGDKSFIGDSFQNLQANLGYGANNLSTGSAYAFNPITRNRIQLEFMYRGSWLVKQVVDAVADDMTRAGVSIDADISPDEIDELNRFIGDLFIFQSLNETIKWGRLYGGAIAVLCIDGQRLEDPLRISTVGKDQFKGLVVFDRWTVWPEMSDTIDVLGPDYGKPKYYRIVADRTGTPSGSIHHSRVVRIDGVQLPFWQRISENSWGLSVIEPLFDRLIAFDSATQGAAQLVYKAHLRTLQIQGLRELIATGGKSYTAFLAQIQNIRLMQQNEGLTVLDAEDAFDVHQYAFGGISDLLIQFSQQISGAAQIPLTRLFGQSPAGMNATGESDMRNYYDAINSQQEARLRRPFMTIFEVAYRSCFGKALPEGFSFSFNPLWQLQNAEKASIASQITSTVDQAMAGGLIGRKTALKELRGQSKVTGVWSNITDEDIEAADDELPGMNEMAGGPPGAGAQPGQPPSSGTPPSQNEPTKPPSGKESDDPPSNEDTRPMEDDAAKRRRAQETIAHLAGQAHPNARIPSDLVPVGTRHVNPAGKLESILNPDDKYARVRAMFAPAKLTADRASLREVAGINVVIETAKGERREGAGWSQTMPADYGYICGTSSAEGSQEQMDCFIGPAPEVDRAYVIRAKNDKGLFDEHKIMLGYPSRAAAEADFETSYGGRDRIMRVDTKTIPQLKTWLLSWHYGKM